MSTPAPADPEPCDHDWHVQDDSFDHEFGTEIIRYWQCQKCDATMPLGKHQADFDP